MDSIFKEQLVKKEKNSVDMAKRVGIIIVAIILFFAANMFLKSIGIFVSFGIFYGAYYVLQRTNIEFEYVFTNGDLDIDKIFSKSKRKHALSVNIKKFDIVVPVNDKNYENEISRCEKVLDFSSGKVNKNTYAAVFTHEGKRTKLLFEPNDKMLEAMKHYIPRKLKWKKYGQY